MSGVYLAQAQGSLLFLKGANLEESDPQNPDHSFGVSHANTIYWRPEVPRIRPAPPA